MGLVVKCFVVLLINLCCIRYGVAEIEEGPLFSTSYTAESVDHSYVLDSELNEEVYSDQWKCGFPWSRKNSSCECGDSIHESVYCNLNRKNMSWTKVGILSCSCITFDDSLNTTVVGHCFLNCENGSASDHSRINRVYHVVNRRNLNIPQENFTDSVCGYLNRNGRLCGKCKDGFYPPVYSYNSNCVRCKNEWYNWALFIAEAFVPLTLFLLFISVFRISATSAELSAFVLFSQNFTIPSNVQLFLAATSRIKTGNFFAKLYVTLYSVWNLDFFRAFYPPICLHVTTMQIILLEYSIAFYPLLLLLLFYLGAKSHMTRLRGIRCLWVSMHSRMNTIRETWNFKRSIIDSFATFTILSYSKLLSISFHSVMYTNVHDADGVHRGRYVYNDASLEYFGKEHWFYGILSLLVLILFIVFPVVLMCVYPMKCFQRTLSRFRMNYDLLRIFMDSFQGCYKDGTNGTRDCRFFGGAYLFLRILLFTAFGFTLTSLFYSFATVLFIGMAILIIIVRPYKERYAVYNKVDAIMILMQALMTASILCHIFAEIKGERFKIFSIFLVALFNTLPLIYVTVIITRWFYNRSNIHLHSVMTRIKDILSSSARSRSETEELLNNSHSNYGSTSIN